MKVRALTKKMTSLAASLAVAASLLAAPLTASAAVANPAPAANISFTFDDGYTSALTQAAPTLAKYGLTGTDYVITRCVGMTKAPNTCRAGTDDTYMTWAQINTLRNTYGWEIGSHSHTHPYLASKDASDGQPNVLTKTQVINELTQSKSALAAQGINATSFSSPYGDYNMTTLAEVAKLYTTHRGFADVNNNIWPHNDYLLNNFQVQAGVSVAQVKTKIDQAIANKTWLVLTFHDIKTNPSNDPDEYEYSTSNLDQIAAYVKSKQSAGLLKSVNVSQGPVTSDTNLLANSSFNSGIAGGWRTDGTTNITADSANNGSYPDAAKSVKLTSTTKNTHLFSPKVNVSSANNYMLKTFLNVQKITSGSVGFYIDEYDAAGNWISGQYKKSEPSVYVESLNFTYQPTNAAVRSASLQVIVPANSGMVAYLDNVQWFSLTNVPVPPVTNLMPNGNFDAGIANGWTTDKATAITKDAAGNGSPANPVNSIKMVAANAHAHLFSPKVALDATKTYNYSTYVNIKQLASGEIGFYIDEYDAAGNWISGQYKTGVRSVGVGTVSFSYQPSSSNVKTSSLQIILVGNSGITGYVDDVQLIAL